MKRPKRWPLASVDDCPRPHLHTPHPVGYLAFFEWCDRKSRTHRPTRCPGCGLWAVWKRKAKRPAPRPRRKGAK